MKTTVGRFGAIAVLLAALVASAQGTPEVWTGEDLTFTKEADSDWTSADNQDRITDNVWITRGDKKGIFNIAKEPGYKPSPPEGTEWAYGAAKDWKSLRFHSWETFNSRIPPNMVGEDAVLHLIEEDVYLDIKFTSWTEGPESGGNGGGGFSYDRATEKTPGEKVWTGDSITFTKGDYADWTLATNQDRITDDVWITRRDVEGIFNIAKEREYRLNPPSGTRWAYGTAANHASLTFLPWAKLHNKNPSSMVGKAAVLHLLDAGVYIDIKFLTWNDEAAGSGFSYERATEGTKGETVWTGQKTTFTRANDADWTAATAQDRINDDVWITRARWDGIFNIANESAYQPYPPAGTEWAYGSAADWASLTFMSWEALHDKSPPDLIDKSVVLHLIEDDIYLDIKFLEWSEDDTGGGFSYVRAGYFPVTIDDGPIALPSRVNIGNAFVSFRVVVSDADGDPFTCDWDFGDGTTGSGTDTSHTYTAAGDYTVTVTVSDGSVTHVRSLAVDVNTPPRIDAGPTATPVICLLGEAIAFGAAATDDDGDPLTYIWSFGDGDTANGAAASHAYANAGDYAVVVDVTDGFANARGTVDVVVARPASVTKLKGNLNFKKPDRDKLEVKADLELPADFAPEGKSLRIDVGGVEASFVLSRKGKAKSFVGSAALKFKKKTGLWTLQVKLKKGAFAAAWNDDGAVNKTVKAVPISLACRIEVDGRSFFADRTVAYTGKTGKAGKFK